jgi:hypothetical protein
MLRTATVGPRFGVSYLVALYLIAGGIIAANHHYWDHLHTWKGIASALLATVAWPLIFLDVNLHVQ